MTHQSVSEPEQSQLEGRLRFRPGEFGSWQGTAQITLSPARTARPVVGLKLVFPGLSVLRQSSVPGYRPSRLP
jgi:hypothetical protein